MLAPLTGGAGFMNEYPIARICAGSRVMQIFGDVSEIMKELIKCTLLWGMMGTAARFSGAILRLIRNRENR